jgi:hypothetical protein
MHRAVRSRSWTWDISDGTAAERFSADTPDRWSAGQQLLSHEMQEMLDEARRLGRHPRV